MPTKGAKAPPNPIMKHFKVNEGVPICMYCEKPVKGAMQRRRCHLGLLTGRDVFICTAPPPDDVVEEAKRLQDAEDQRAAVRAHALQNSAFEGGSLGKQPSSPSEAAGSSAQANKRARTLAACSTKGNLLRCLSLQERARLDNLWARASFACNIHFNVFDQPEFRDAVSETAKLGASYKPPPRQRIAGKLLEDNYKSCVVEQGNRLVFDNAMLLGQTFMSDGWTDMNKVPILNFCVSTNQRDALVDIEHCLDAPTKDAEYIADSLERGFQALVAAMVASGHELKAAERSVVQVLTDGAAACQIGRDEFAGKHPWMITGWCSLHVISLFFGDVFKRVQLYSRTYDRLHSLIKYMRSHEKTVLTFNKLRSGKEGVRALGLPGPTRMAGKYSMIADGHKQKDVIQATFTNPTVSAWGGKLRGIDKGYYESAKSTAFDTALWLDVETVTKRLADYFMLLRLADGSTPAMGKIYGRMLELDAAFTAREDDADEEEKQVHAFFQSRWEQLSSPLHCAGYALDPEFFGRNQVNNQEVMDGLKEVCNKWLTAEEAGKALEQWLQIVTKQGIFGQERTFEQAKEMSATNFYLLHSSVMPELAKVAQRVLSQPIAVGICERVWSNYAWIEGKLRGKMLPEKSKMLVMIYIALRLKRSAESGMWEPDSLEWASAHTFDDWLAIAEEEAEAFVAEQEAEAAAALREAQEKAATPTPDALLSSLPPAPLLTTPAVKKTRSSGLNDVEAKLLPVVDKEGEHGIGVKDLSVILREYNEQQLRESCHELVRHGLLALRPGASELFTPVAAAAD